MPSTWPLTGVGGGGTGVMSSVSVLTGGFIDLYNLGGPGDANFERLRANWLANVAQIFTQNDGTGSGRALRVGATSTDGLTTPNVYTQWRSGTLPTVTQELGSGNVTGVWHELASTSGGGLNAVAGTQTAVAVSPTFAGTGTQAGIALLVNPSGTFGSGGGLLQQWQLASSERGRFTSGGTFQSVNVNATGQLGIASAFGSGPDVILERDTGDALAQRRGTSAQTFRIYNTYTDGSNYERGGLLWSSNVLFLQTEQAGTGTARAMKVGTVGLQSLTLKTNNTDRWIVTAAGDLTPATDGASDLGTPGAPRVRNLYMASWIRQAVFTVGTLPAAATAGAGATAFVSDANAPVFGAAVAGGGAVTVPVYSTGAAWNVG